MRIAGVKPSYSFLFKFLNLNNMCGNLPMLEVAGIAFQNDMESGRVGRECGGDRFCCEVDYGVD
jgi:hypothetical protein